MNNLLEVKGLCKSFPGFSLDRVGFTLPEGYIMGLVGPNGAGKTTTIQLILNMLQKDSGVVTVFGLDHTKHEQEIKQSVGVVFDSSIYVESWTVSSTEKAISVFYPEWDHHVFRDMVASFDLPVNKKIGEFSRGMQMKLMLACAFSHNAKLLILDEPTSGLDPVTRDELLEILQDYIRDGQRSVLFSTHITTDLERIADYVTFLNRGSVFYSGSMDDLVASYRLIKGNPAALTHELEQRIIGLRKTRVGFEGIVRTNDTHFFRNCMFEDASVDQIIISVSKGAGRPGKEHGNE